MTTNKLDDVFEFLRIAGEKGFMNSNTVGGRRTAFNKLLTVLDADQQNVEYIRENLTVIKTRFQHLNPDVRGTTVDEYARRIEATLEDFTFWQSDRAGWEREITARGVREPRAANGDTEKKARTSHSEKKQQPLAEDIKVNSSARVLTFPLRPDFEVIVHLPRDGITRLELQRLGMFLYPYVKDFGAAGSTSVIFPGMLRSLRRRIRALGNDCRGGTGSRVAAHSRPPRAPEFCPQTKASFRGPAQKSRSPVGAALRGVARHRLLAYPGFSSVSR